MLNLNKKLNLGNLLLGAVERLGIPADEIVAALVLLDRVTNVDTTEDYNYETNCETLTAENIKGIELKAKNA